MRSKGIWITIAVMVVVVLGGLALLNHRSKTADDSQVRQTDQPAAGEKPLTTVTIKDMAFAPGTLTVKKGATVTWVNQDSMTHTVTSDTDTQTGINSSSLAAGSQYSFTFTAAGTYKYHCSLHPSMTGVIVVTE